jgi:hypothetical protein
MITALTASPVELSPVRASRHIFELDLGGVADVAQAASEEGSTDTKPTREVTR